MMTKQTRFYVNTVMAVLVALLWGSAVFAGALTAARDTAARTGVDVSVGMASNTVIYAGSLVAINTSGYAVPASDTAGYKVIGRAQATVDNSGTAGNGALSINVRRGVFLWANGDSFTIADVGNLAYVEDDQTVQKAASATHDVVAGIIIDVESDGVWVDSYAIGSQGAAALTTLTTTGNAAVGGTLDVAGVMTLTAAPKLTAATTAGAETVAMTNAPAAGDPIWADVTVGSTTYVMPLFPKE